MFPKWIPEWVKDEFFLLETKHKLPIRPEHLKLLESKKTKSVWDSLRNAGFNKEAEYNFLLLPQLGALLDCISYGLGSFDSYTMTNAERKLSAEKIISQSNDLANLLESLIPSSQETGIAKMYFLRGAYNYSADFVESEFEEIFSMISSWHDSNQEISASFERSDKEFMMDVCKSLLASVIFQSPKLLRQYSSIAEEFRNYPQYIAKPNHPNARRLYFIRTLTEFFFSCYGRPMRKETLTITSVFFECDDIVEADLSRLAPVSKLNNR
jgi:hypothetical protein